MSTAPRTLGLIRRAALVLATTGIAGLGGVLVAPAASASTDLVHDGPNSVVVSNAGPDAFIVKPHGVLPVFFCDPMNPNRQQTTCISVSGGRF